MNVRSYAIVLIVVVSLFSLCMADDRVDFARSLTANDYDKSLPAQRIEEWLKSVLPQGIVVIWEKEITDCGEQTGDPKIDKERDMPLCAAIELKQNNNTIGYLMLFIGTHNKGNLKKSAGLYFGSVTLEGKTIWLKKLSDLAAIKWPQK